MDCDNVLQLEMTLEKLSGIALAIYFWNLPDVKIKVDTYFRGRNNLTLRYDENWRKIISEVLQIVNLVDFPDKLLVQVKNIIPLIGERIYNWTVYVIQRKNYDLKYAQRIYWTPHGKIDEIKIVQEFWLKEMEFKSVNCYLKKPLFCIAVRYAQWGFVKKNMDEMKEELMKLLPAKEGRRDKGWTPYHVLYAWLVFCTSKGQNLAMETIENLKLTPAEIPKKLFMKCISNGYGLHPAKYFWDQLTWAEKTNSIMEAASTCQSRLYLMHNHSYIRENELETIIFLINHMTIGQSMRFISTHFLTLFHNFLTVWPYQELCINFLNQNLDIDAGTLKSLFKMVLKKLTKDKIVEYENKYIYQMILHKLLEKNPKRLKERYFIKLTKAKFTKMYKNLKVCYLVQILNDQDLKEEKHVVMNNCNDILKGLALNGNNEELDEFMNFIFFDDEEGKKNFKKRFNFSNLLLSCGKFELADKHLLWHGDDKEKINSDHIFLNLVQNSRFELADKFLSWRFDSEEERKNFLKDLGKSDKFLRDEIYKIWGARNPSLPLPSIQDKCNLLLNIFLDDDNSVLKFKKSLIKNKFFIVKYWKNLIYQKSFAHLHEFLTFCTYSEEEILKMKIVTRNEINFWIDKFVLEDLNIHMVLALLDWVFENSEKKKIIENYMNSPKGALLCFRVFKKYSASYKRLILDFFNYWIKPSLDLDVSQIRMNLDLMDESTIRGKIKSTILTLLDKRKNGYMILAGDIPGDVYTGFLEEDELSDVDMDDENDGSDDDSSMLSGNDSAEELGAEQYEFEEEDYNGEDEAEAEAEAVDQAEIDPDPEADEY